MAVTNNASTQAALARVFVSHVPAEERTNTIRDLAAQVHNDTLGLVAALIDQNHDEEAERNLLGFLQRSIEGGEYSAAASICLQYPYIRTPLLQLADKNFLDLLKKNLQSVLNPTNPDEDVEPDQTPATSQVTVYLDFLRQIFRIARPENGLLVSEDIFIGLAHLLSIFDASRTSSARDALYSFLSAYKEGNLAFEGPVDVLDEYLWECICSLLWKTDDSLACTMAYAVWLRWLNLPRAPAGDMWVMHEDKYWQFILRALANGDLEQRKTCLHILRSSLAIATTNISTKDMVVTEGLGGLDAVRAEYERFSTVYETIIIGRYVNQAEECMKDLDFLASSRTIVKKSWLFALIQPALSYITQDSIRKLIGNWLMSTDLDLAGQTTEFCNVLQKTFLPWACQGPPFTSSVKGTTRIAQCEHGIRLASFVERLMRSNAAEDNLAVSRTILDYLSQNRNRIIAYAVVYLLHGLVQGLKANTSTSLGAGDLDVILNLINGTALPGIARDVVQSQCLALAQLVDAESRELSQASDSRLAALSLKTQKLSLGSVSDDAAVYKPQWQDLEHFLKDLHNTRHQSIAGERLSISCRSLIAILDSTNHDERSPAHANETLEALWTEMDIQDYPKQILALIPGLVLHPVVVSLALQDETLSATISSYVSELHEFCSGKIYVWTPLIKALRTALISVPSAAANLGISEFIIATANNPPTAGIEHRLEAAAVRLLPPGCGDYTNYYGGHEEEGFAAFFDLVNRLPQIDKVVANEVFDSLIQPWLEQKVPVPVVNKWKRTTQLQVMLILQEHRLSDMTTAQARDHTNMLHKLLSIDPLPRYRLLLEWMICRVIINHPETSEDVLQRLLTVDHHSNPKYLSSLVKVGLMIACLEETSEDFSSRLACRVVALASSQKIIIRHEAQWSFPILWDAAVARGLASITENPACRALNEYIRSLEAFVNPPLERQLEFLDPVTGHNLVNLLQGSYMRMDPPTPSLTTARDLHNLQERDASDTRLPTTSFPTGSLPIGEELPSSSIIDPAPPSAQKPNPQQAQQESARAEAITALQTKGTAYLSTSSSFSSQPITTDIIVVGTLVDNATNLGGLCRISEIFGASALHIARARSVVANPAFVSTSVSSHHHIPVLDLSPSSLIQFLTTKKTEGYTVVGVEQTDRSVVCGGKGVELPRRCVLVMGAEREGISGEVLGECEVLVEIPQFGVTRSLNVQTAAGVVMFEWVRQFRGK